MTATIVSAHFNPGHISHLLALNLLFKNLHYEVFLLLNKDYIDYFKNLEKDINHIICFNGAKKVPKSDIVLIYAMSHFDVELIKEFRKKNKCKIFVVNHEPWHGLQNTFKFAVANKLNPKWFVKALGVHEVSMRIMKKADAVLLPSPKAVELFLLYDKKANSKYYEFPLVYTDEIDNDNKTLRKYFSFISNAKEEKGFPEFINFLTTYMDKDKSLMAQIVTRTNIERYLNDKLNKFVEEGRLHLQYGRSLSNDEINKAMCQSICTWLMYNRSTQSGVLARAFMCGSPVIASDIDSFTKYINGKNGIICETKSPENIYIAYKKIVENVDRMSEESRKSFNQFIYTEQIDNMQNIIEDIQR